MPKTRSSQCPDRQFEKVSVAILSYNRCDELKKSLNELLRNGDCWHEIIVADNGSSDGTVELLRSEFPTVRLIQTGGNYGVFGSNLAYKAATGDWVLSLDDDSCPILESFGALHDILMECGYAAAIALSVRRQQVKGSFKGQTFPLPKAFGFSSAGVLFNRRALADIGTYDPELFLFTNELHWTARALSRGWTLFKADNVSVIHRSAPSNRSDAMQAYFYTRNMLLFLLRFAPDSMIRKLSTRYFQWAVVYSVLHRTSIYYRAISGALGVYRRFPKRYYLLDEKTMTRINPDLRAGFTYLG
jgi:hypothetical protein